MANGDDNKDPYSQYEVKPNAPAEKKDQSDPYAQYAADSAPVKTPPKEEITGSTILRYSGLPGMEQMLEGVGEGALQTVGGISKGLNKLPVIGEKLAPTEGVNALRKIATPENGLQRFGAGAEQAAELAATGPEKGAGLGLKMLTGATTGGLSVAGHEAGSGTGEVRPTDVALGTVAGGAAPAVEKGAETLANSKLSRGFVNESMGANARDVTYGNPAKALLDEGIATPFTGDIEKYKDALRSGATPEQAAQAAGGRFAAVSGKIAEISPRVQAALANSTQMIKVADVIDKPLNKAINEIIANRAMTEPEKIAAFNQLAELHLSLRSGLKDFISPAEANEIKHQIGERVNWGGNVSVGDEVKPAYRELYGTLKDAVNKAVPETAELNERLTNLLSARKDLQRLATQEEVGAGRGMAGGAIGRNLMGRAESTAGRLIPFGAQASSDVGRGAVVTGLPAMTQTQLPKPKVIGPLER
jgi:hypothetical protein